MTPDVPPNERPDRSPPQSQLPGRNDLEDAGSIALSEALRSSFLIVRLLLVGLVVYFLVSNVKSIGNQERAIVLRFGKPVMRDGQIEQGPGLVWALPYPIDEVIRIPYTELQTARSSVGWYAVTAAQEEQGITPDAMNSLNPAVQGYAITADGNIMHARAFVRYRISEPVDFYLNHRNGTALLTNIIDNALTYAASRYRVVDALLRDSVGFKEVVLKRARELVAEHKLGVTIEPSDVQVAAPLQLREQFNAVTTAESDRGRIIEEARAYAHRVLNEAQGEAEARINAGRTERHRLLQAITSEAQRFAQLLPNYERNPEFFRRRLQLEAVGRIMTNVADKWSLPRSSERDVLRLHLNREPEIPRTNRPSLQP
jgi:membrane protease subunit HflK